MEKITLVVIILVTISSHSKTKWLIITICYDLIVLGID